ncbi:MAG TPA: VCBS repeat-containing protein, partial [Polyangium sp.]|nr:VCBS repeat-containing protein [Polyangium sp.]
MDGGGGSSCTPGQGCGEGGLCTSGGVCCAKNKACGALCCPGAEVCSFQQCVTPGDPCVDSSDCAVGSYCEHALDEMPDAGMADASCLGGAVFATGRCLPRPPDCAPGMEPGPNDPITCFTKCEYHPPAGVFEPVLKYSWGDPKAPMYKDAVMMTPVVIQLDDDTCDGVVNERDIPEIVFMSFPNGVYGAYGKLHAISIVNGQIVEKWSAYTGDPSSLDAGENIAAGNIDGVPGNEIVVCTYDERARAYDAQGKELWTSAPGHCFMPSLADLDQDGDVEVILESQILDGKTGATVSNLPLPLLDHPNRANIVPYDVDNDGKLDIVSAVKVMRPDGSTMIDTGLVGTFVAVGDLDKDGVAEIIGPDFVNHRLRVWHLDPSAPGGYKMIRSGIDINGTLSPTLCPPGSSGSMWGGGPPTVADFNGDGFPDVGLAGGIGYAAFDGKKLMDPNVADADTFIWLRQTLDCSSSSTGSSVFDFDGDGRAEVIYADEYKMHVYAGPDGSVLFETCNTDATLFEYPVVADVDNDGQADLVVVSNSYYPTYNCDDGSRTTGVRVYGDKNGNWVRTRRIWNEHAYHVTNVEEDGTIPKVEAPNFKNGRLNNYRQNVQPAGEFFAPDLVASVVPLCGGSYGLLARVRNIGEAAAPPGVNIGLYAGDPAAGGKPLPGSPLVTTKSLYPAESEELYLPLPNPPPGVVDGSVKIYVVVDDNAPPHAWHECHIDNNIASFSGVCDGGPK